ncbi:B3 domain-containing protein Os03g0620400-like [Triticum aestivum]|uniref:B3 domain-containing protein Os03g0620400-like n=1 Tax=Triticum aestivum TaxID=4565 RepID=UPI001D003DFD|nr:B3 domain-containing protein Os03g0620400-like [Triticum aestivum]
MSMWTTSLSVASRSCYFPRRSLRMTFSALKLTTIECAEASSMLAVEDGVLGDDIYEARRGQRCGYAILVSRLLAAGSGISFRRILELTTCNVCPDQSDGAPFIREALEGHSAFVLGSGFDRMEELSGLGCFEFFVIILPNFLKKLRLPDKFVAVHDGREPREVKLREAGCQHRLWDVEVVFDADCHMYLRHGWEQFARAHDLRLGHFLVLSYDDRPAVLTVKVFDGSMCRRHYQHGDVAKNPSADESVQLNDVQMPSKDYFLSGKCDLTVAQKAKIHEFIAEIQPKIPVFIVLIKKSNIDRRGTLGVSKEYALKYFPCEDTNIILQLPRKNKAWKCRLHIRPSSISNPGRRSLNWGPFACDNDVREGDIFLFQPMTNVKQRRFLVTVHLIHNATRDHSPCGRTDIGTNRGSTSAKMGGVKEEPPINGTKMLQLLGCMCHTSEHEEHEVSEDSERASEPLFILAERASLSPEQNLKCLEKVEEIKFKPPFYVAIMSKSSVCQRGSRCSAKLHFGSQYAATYLVQKFAAGLHREKNSSISLVLQREGKSRSWPTKLQCKYRMGDTCNQMTYLNGWTSFARDNHLRVGDICLFKLMDNEEQLSMMVYIVRR